MNADNQPPEISTEPFAEALSGSAETPRSSRTPRPRSRGGRRRTQPPSNEVVAEGAPESAIEAMSSGFELPTAVADGVDAVSARPRTRRGGRRRPASSRSTPSSDVPALAPFGADTPVAETAVSEPEVAAPTGENTSAEPADAPAPRSRGRRGGRRRTAARAAQSDLPETSTESAPEEATVERSIDAAAIATADDADVEEVAPPPARKGRAKAVASPVTIDVVVPRGFSRRVDSKLVRKVVERALDRNGWADPASLDVVFVTDVDMKEINATRRGIDEATDVLSFPTLDLQPGQGLTHDFFLLPPDTLPHLGDVVISVDRFETQADEAGHSRQRELAFLTVHGVLHILGFDHESEDERRQMRRREEEVLAELGLRRDGV